MRGGTVDGLLFDEFNLFAALGELPRRFAARKPRTDDGDHACCSGGFLLLTR